MPRELTQVEVERLVAWLDGELDRQEAQQVEARVQSDQDWQRAANGFAQVDALLGSWDAPPLRRDLSDSILARAHHRRLVPAWLAVLAPLAAAAMIFLAVWASYAMWPFQPAGRSGPSTVAAQPSESPLQTETDLHNRYGGDAFVVENLDILQDYDVLLTDFDTLQAIDMLEDEGEGT